MSVAINAIICVSVFVRVAPRAIIVVVVAKFSVGCSASSADCLFLTGCVTSVAILGVLDVVTAAYGTLMEVLIVLVALHTLQVVSQALS